MNNPGEPIGQVIGLFTGKIEHLWVGKQPSAIAKKPVNGPCRIKTTGLYGDTCADLTVHGGPDQAIHHYAAEHMAFWQNRFAEDHAKFFPGCFGENIATTGLDETNLCIGDVLQLGSARVQVSQGRQPCWKLDAHLGRNDMAHAFRLTCKTGWYYRVLEPGFVEMLSFMHVIERPAPKWPIHAVIEARFRHGIELETAQELADLAPLSAEWRSYFRGVAQET